jgi:3-methylfumaryl-CoA hydratase
LKLIQARPKIKHVGKTKLSAKPVINLDRAREWLGRVDVRADVAAPSQLATLFDLLDLAEPTPEVGGELPPLAHWLYFSSWGRSSETGENGDYLDPALPPIELPRRACVECRIQFHRPIRIGDPISRLTRVVDVAERAGRAGPIVTLLLRHEITDAEGVAVSEERRLLYMARGEAWHSSGPRQARGFAEWSRQFQPDTRALFRYSALTRNMSRVHYDRPFALFVEGHPGLVVQGELVAALLLDILREHLPRVRVRSCELRTQRWLYDTEPMFLFGRPRDDGPVELWAEDAQGRLAMEGLVTLDGDLSQVRGVDRAASRDSRVLRPPPRLPSRSG